MKLCLIGNPNSIHVRRWAAHFVNRGDEVHLVGAHPLAMAPPEGVHFYDVTAGFNLPKLRYAVWAQRARTLVRKMEPDLVHAHFVNAGGWLGAATGVHPFVVSAHGSDLLVQPQQSWLFRELAHWVLKRADKVLCVSSQLMERAYELGANAGRVEVLPLGVDLDVFHSGHSTAARAEPWAIGPGPLVVHLRAIKPIYNPLEIAQAIPLIRRRAPGARFAILTYNSEPALLTQFQRLVQESGAGDAVHYVRNLDDEALADLMRAADVAISIPSSDGMPVSVQEAMACGTPLVLSDIPSMRAWIPEATARFVPLHDIDALAAAVIDLLSDRSLGARMGEKAATYISANLSRHAMMQRAEAIYADLLGQE